MWSVEVAFLTQRILITWHMHKPHPSTLFTLPWFILCWFQNLSFQTMIS